MIVGEAYGEKEAETGQPFVGPSGWLLDNLLGITGISRKDCYLTNVFNLQPKPKNDIINLCGTKAEAIDGYPAVQSGKYIHRQYAPELERLYREITRESPTLIIAMGATAAWALLGTTGIKKIRGAPLYTAGKAAAVIGQYKVLPTYHPAAVMRDYGLRPVVISDLAKAKREADYPDIRRPRREIWVEPDLTDLAEFEHLFISPSPDLSIDIETAGDQITCVGFAPSVDRALVIPFVDPVKVDGNYWPSLADELVAWSYVQRWCGLPKAIVGQNFNYDMHFMLRRYGIPVPHARDDTMLMHHAMQPELEKGLAFLGSVYTDEAQWKFMRTKHETVKRED